MGKDEIEEVLKKNGWMSVRDLGDVLPTNTGNINNAVKRMSKTGEVKKRIIRKRVPRRNGTSQIREINEYRYI